MSSIISTESSEVISKILTPVGETEKFSHNRINLHPTTIQLRNTSVDSKSALDITTPHMQFTNSSNNHFPISTPMLSVPNTAQQSIILTPPPVVKPQQVVLQNPNTLQTLLPITLPPKNRLGYVTMIKRTKQSQIPTLPKPKFVLACMPQSTNRRNDKVGLKSPRVNTPSLLTKQGSMIKVKIANGKTDPENNNAITVMSTNNRNENSFEKSTSTSDPNISNLSSCEGILDSDTTINNTVSNKTVKHGVSILKKNFTLESKGAKEMSSVNNSNSLITTVSDTKSKDVCRTTSSTQNKFDDAVISIITPSNQKSERRRKSRFACKQDYDEVIFSENIEIAKVKKKKGVQKSKDPDIQIITDKFDINPDINMKADLAGINDLLVWEDDIGTLPGSDIKFTYNKYKFLQILTREEYIQIMNKKVSKSKMKQGVLEEMCCLQCGCFGLPSEFISPKYCSYDCRDIGLKAFKIKERNYRLRAYNCYKKSQELNSSTETAVTEVKEKEMVNTSIEEEVTSNENSQDKYNCPWSCPKKGFSWTKYLEHIKAKAAPLKLFKDPFPYGRNGFRPGMKLEGIDPQHPSHFCVLTVVEVVGYRVRLHFDGYSDNYDFWVNADSADIFPAGWCEKFNHVLDPPPGFKDTEFTWTAYMKNTRCILAPKHLFADLGSTICPNGFRVGMKLEAVDRKNTSLVCVATVMNTMENRFLVHFDSWDDIYDYWADPTSPYIHPVGWADKNGHSLTPPNDYPSPEAFTWESYLRNTKCVAAPARAFKQRGSCGFKKGMRLECVDKRVPRLVRVATVDEVKDHQIRISFDGWADCYSYWIDSDSTNIHPVGWCYKTGHPIEAPLTTPDVYDFLECPTAGCRGQGHIEGAKIPTHSLLSECPYSKENMYKEHILPDRLLSPDRQLQSVVPVSREPKEKSKKNPKIKRSIQTDECDEIDFENEDVKPCKQMKNEPEEESNGSLWLPLTNGYVNEDLENVWEQHSKFLLPHIKSISNPQLWDQTEVARFISQLPDCQKYSVLFLEQNIDGPAFLMLSQSDLIELLNIKLGPAIKIYSIIMLLRRHRFC